MLSFKKLLLLGVALVGAVNAAPTGSPDQSLAVRDTAPPVDIPVDFATRSVSENEVDKRATSRTRLFWSSQGRFLFMMNLGSKVPQAVIDGFAGLGEAGPGKQLMQNFIDWTKGVMLEYRDVDAQHVIQAINSATVKGGMYSKGGQTAYIGWAVQLNTNDANIIRRCTQLINDWATATGPNVALNLRHNPTALYISQRANDFISLAKIGAGSTAKRDEEGIEDALEQRSRTDTCPAGNWQMLNYAVGDVSEGIDYNNYLRFGGLCQF